MKNEPSPKITAAEVLSRIQMEIASPTREQSSTPFAGRMAALQSMQRRFRSEPLGGRLVAFKRLFSWFSASTFDRQAKVIEELLDLVEDLGNELDRQRVETDRLRIEVAKLSRSSAAAS